MQQNHNKTSKRTFKYDPSIRLTSRWFVTYLQLVGRSLCIFFLVCLFVGVCFSFAKYNLLGFTLTPYFPSSSQFWMPQIRDFELNRFSKSRSRESSRELINFPPENYSMIPRIDWRVFKDFVFGVFFPSPTQRRFSGCRIWSHPKEKQNRISWHSQSKHQHANQVRKICMIGRIITGNLSWWNES